MLGGDPEHLTMYVINAKMDCNTRVQWTTIPQMKRAVDFSIGNQIVDCSIQTSRVQWATTQHSTLTTTTGVRL